jgi:putative transposase
MSERHACALVGLSRDTDRHEGQTSALNMELREQIVQTAHARRRWGYRMIHDVLRPQYPGINHKRVYRIYTAEGLSIRKRKKAKRIGVRVPLVAAMAVNQTWSMDYWTGPRRSGATPKKSEPTTDRNSPAGHS